MVQSDSHYCREYSQPYVTHFYTSLYIVHNQWMPSTNLCLARHFRQRYSISTTKLVQQRTITFRRNPIYFLLSLYLGLLHDQEYSLLQHHTCEAVLVVSLGSLYISLQKVVVEVYLFDNGSDIPIDKIYIQKTDFTNSKNTSKTLGLFQSYVKNMWLSLLYF